MSFITLEKMRKSGGSNSGRASVSYSRPQSTGGKIYISGKLATQLGWKAKDRVAVAMGSGADYGTIRISRAAEGYAISNNGGKKSAAVSLCFNHFNDAVKAFNNTELQYSIVGGALYAKLPSLLLTSTDGAATYSPQSEARAVA